MPGTAQAALVFLAIVVPGFLAMAGYRLGRAVPDHPRGLVATARVITVSAIIAVIAWRLGGRALYEHVRAGTALTEHEAQTYRFAVELLLIPGVVGFVLAELVDATTDRVLASPQTTCRLPRPRERRESRWDDGCGVGC